MTRRGRRFVVRPGLRCLRRFAGPPVWHRWHVHNALGLDAIEADVRKGGREAALRHSLGANAEHGARRNEDDYKRAYFIAVRNHLVLPTDHAGVQSLLHCSGSWAEKLTAAAKIEAKALRDAEIAEQAAKGKSVRQIAAATGVPKSTVGRAVAVPKPHSVEMGHPPERSAAAQHLDELETPAALAWADALAALRLINEQDDVDALFAERFTRFDHAIAVEIDRAAAVTPADLSALLRSGCPPGHRGGTAGFAIRRYFRNVATQSPASRPGGPGRHSATPGRRNGL